MVSGLRLPSVWKQLLGCSWPLLLAGICCAAALLEAKQLWVRPKVSQAGAGGTTAWLLAATLKGGRPAWLDARLPQKSHGSCTCNHLTPDPQVKAARLHPRSVTAAGSSATRGVGEAVQHFVQEHSIALLVLGSRGLGSIQR